MMAIGNSSMQVSPLNSIIALSLLKHCKMLVNHGSGQQMSTTVEVTAVSLAIQSQQQSFKNHFRDIFYSNIKINCAQTAALLNYASLIWKIKASVQANKKQYRTKNGVKRVFLEHHQLTLQYLTDEVLKLKYTQSNNKKLISSDSKSHSKLSYTTTVCVQNHITLR